MKYATIALLVLLVTAAGAAQVDITPPADASRSIPGMRPPAPNEQQIRLKQESLNKLNSDRHAAIKKDTDKLLQLATELKQSVDKSNQNTLSLDVVKKAAEIEKLAKEVKEKMRTGY